MATVPIVDLGPQESQRVSLLSAPEVPHVRALRLDGVTGSYSHYNDSYSFAAIYRAEGEVLYRGNRQLANGGMVGLMEPDGIFQHAAPSPEYIMKVYVDDVDTTYKQVAEQGFETVKEPADMPWGERTAWIADPDGNLLMLTR